MVCIEKMRGDALKAFVKFGLLLATSVLVASPQQEESVNSVLKERIAAVVSAGNRSDFSGVVLAEF